MHNKLLTTKEEIKTWLDGQNIKDYVINDDLTVDVKNSVHLSWRQLDVIPIQFGIIEGSFYCDNNELTTLKGAPKVIKLDFDCRNNYLTDLKGGPEITRDYNCPQNKLLSLKGSPKKVLGIFNCSYNDDLRSLKNGPKVVKNLALVNNSIQINEPLNIKITNAFYHYCKHEHNKQAKAVQKIELFNQYYDNDDKLKISGEIFNNIMNVLKEKKKLEKLTINSNQTNKKLKI
jgi:hypothetical protein